MSEQERKPRIHLCSANSPCIIHALDDTMQDLCCFLIRFSSFFEAGCTFFHPKSGLCLDRENSGLGGREKEREREREREREKETETKRREVEREKQSSGN